MCLLGRFIWHCRQGRTGMMVTDVLVCSRWQDICSLHQDISRSVHFRSWQLFNGSSSLFFLYINAFPFIYQFNLQSLESVFDFSKIRLAIITLHGPLEHIFANELDHIIDRNCSLKQWWFGPMSYEAIIINISYDFLRKHLLTMIVAND